MDIIDIDALNGDRYEIAKELLKEGRGGFNYQSYSVRSDKLKIYIKYFISVNDDLENKDNLLDNADKFYKYVIENDGTIDRIFGNLPIILSVVNDPYGKGGYLIAERILRQ